MTYISNSGSFCFGLVALLFIETRSYYKVPAGLNSSYFAALASYALELQTIGHQHVALLLDLPVIVNLEM